MIIIAFGLGLASVMLNPPEPPPDDTTGSDNGTSTAADADGGQTRRRRGEVAKMTMRILRRLLRRHGDGDADDDDDDTGDDSQFIGPEATFHHKMGLCLFILICLQVAWGFTTRYLAHSQEQKRKKRRRAHSSTIGDDGRSITPVSSEDENEDAPAHVSSGRSRQSSSKKKRHWTQYTHIAFGLGLLILLYIQCWNGLHTEWPDMSEHGDPVPTAILVVFWILVAIPVGPYGIHVLSKLLHKSRDGGKKSSAPGRGGGGAKGDGGQSTDHLPMSDRIVVGGPSSTAAVRFQQQQEEHARDSYRHSASYGQDTTPFAGGHGSNWAPDRTM